MVTGMGRMSSTTGERFFAREMAWWRLSSGPVVIFLTIFLVLLYHLTCVLHSISLAKQNLEAQKSLLPRGEDRRSE